MHEREERVEDRRDEGTMERDEECARATYAYEKYQHMHISTSTAIHIYIYIYIHIYILMGHPFIRF